MIGLTLLAAPLGYAVLTGYLLMKIQPFPITLLPNAMVESGSKPRTLGAAA